MSLLPFLLLLGLRWYNTDLHSVFSALRNRTLGNGSLVLWALIPAVNIYNFATCPIEYLVEDGNGMRIGKLFQKPLFWLFVCLMVCSGASELAMAQWASTYAEAPLWSVKSCRRSDRSMPVCCYDGHQPYYFRKIWGKSLDLMKFMTASGLLCDMLSAYFSVRKSADRTFRLYFMRLFCRNHVAGNDQSFF